MTAPRSDKEIDHKLVDLARNYVVMRRGFWPWEDDKVHLGSDHKPLVNKAELLRSVNLEASHNAYRYFDDRRFQTAVRNEEAYWDSGFYESLSKLDADPLSAGNAMLRCLFLRFAADPGQFSNAELHRYGTDLTKFGILVGSAKKKLQGEGLELPTVELIDHGLEGALPAEVMAHAEQTLGLVLRRGIGNGSDDD